MLSVKYNNLKNNNLTGFPLQHNTNDGTLHGLTYLISNCHHSFILISRRSVINFRKLMFRNFKNV